MSKLCTLFILVLGVYFTTLHNKMTDLPAVWKTENFKQLTTLTCQYLETVINNKERNNLQQEKFKQESEK